MTRVCRKRSVRTPAVCEGIPRGRANGAGMSATGGIVRMPSPAEIAAGGNVVPLRTGSAPVDQTQPDPASALGPVSPELALVDPELRQAARELLPDLPRPRPRREPSGRADAPHPRAGSGARATSPPQPTRSALVGRRRPRARRTAHAGRRSRGAALPTRAADSIGRSCRLPNDRHGHPAGHPTRPPCNHACQACGHHDDAGDVHASSRERSSGTDVCLGRFPGRRGIRVPAVPGRRARLPSARGRSAPRTSGSLAASRPPSRPAARELPLVRVDDPQGHESPVEKADGERKARDRRPAAVILVRPDRITA